MRVCSLMLWGVAEAVWLICEMRMWFYVNIKLLEKCSLLCWAQRDLINGRHVLRVAHYAAKWQEQPLRNDTEKLSSFPFSLLFTAVLPSILHKAWSLFSVIFLDINIYSDLWKVMTNLSKMRHKNLWHAPTICEKQHFKLCQKR